MSGDISGEDAFDRVLDKLVEEGRHRGRDIDARNAAEHARDAAIKEMESARSKLSIATAALADYQGADATDAFGELYDAVETATTRLKAFGDDALAGELLKRLAAAKKFVDPIPF